MNRVDMRYMCGLSQDREANGKSLQTGVRSRDGRRRGTNCFMLRLALRWLKGVLAGEELVPAGQAADAFQERVGIARTVFVL